MPELVVLALPPALAKSWTAQLTVPELLMVAFWAPVVRAKLPLVPELVQVSVLPLVRKAWLNASLLPEVPNAISHSSSYAKNRKRQSHVASI